MPELGTTGRSQRRRRTPDPRATPIKPDNASLPQVVPSSSSPAAGHAAAYCQPSDAQRPFDTLPRLHEASHEPPSPPRKRAPRAATAVVTSASVASPQPQPSGSDGLAGPPPVASPRPGSGCADDESDQKRTRAGAPTPLQETSAHGTQAPATRSHRSQTSMRLKADMPTMIHAIITFFKRK